MPANGIGIKNIEVPGKKKRKKRICPEIKSQG